MQLHGAVRGYIKAVNPDLTLDVQVSTGYVTGADGTQVPAYATPGEYTGSIAGNVLTIATATTGKILPGQTVIGTDVMADTRVLAYLTGEGGVGTYTVTNDQMIAEEVLTTTLIVQGQVQPIEWRDLQQLDGLNLQGTRYVIYFYNRIEGIVRPDGKGGDLITDPYGRTFLTAKVLEQWGREVWCKIAATLQNGG